MEKKTTEPKVEFKEIDSHNWEQYRQIRLKGLLDTPQAFGASYSDEVNKDSVFWINKYYLFFIYTGKEVPSYDLVFEKTGTVLKKMIKLVSENIQ